MKFLERQEPRPVRFLRILSTRLYYFVQFAYYNQQDLEAPQSELWFRVSLTLPHSLGFWWRCGAV